MSKDINEVYQQRNALALALARVMPGSGWGVDETKVDWDDDWKTVLYIETPEGQVSFHLDPEIGALARASLPRYQSTWDGTWWDEHKIRLGVNP